MGKKQVGEHELRPWLIHGLVDRIEVEARPIELALAVARLLR